MLLPTATPPSGTNDLWRWIVAAVLLLAGLLHFVGAFRARHGEFKTTIGRQLRGGLGPRGALAFLIVMGALLVAGGLWFGAPLVR